MISVHILCLDDCFAGAQRYASNLSDPTKVTNLSIKWSFPAAGPPVGAFKASPIVVNDTVFIGSEDGIFYSLDAATGRLRWHHDDDEQPCGCIGELSVSWVAPLKEWLMLYNCEGAVRARLARAPWGRWSDPTEIFRPDTDNAWCRYMHAENDPPCDHLDGDNFNERGGGANGDPYAPYVLSRFTSATPQGARIIFLMSTWNPYQVVAMQTNLTSGH